MKSKSNKSKCLCPIHPINIDKKRKIIKCDSLNFKWKADKNGYFLVKIENKLICCGFVSAKNHKMLCEFRSKPHSIDKMIKEIAKRKLVDLEHMGYIASELERAKFCIKQKKEYIQR